MNKQLHSSSPTDLRKAMSSGYISELLKLSSLVKDKFLNENLGVSEVDYTPLSEQQSPSMNIIANNILGSARKRLDLPKRYIPED